MPVNRYRGALIRRRALGAAALLGAVAVALLLWKRPDPFSTAITVRADFADADGLAPIGADVRVAGVPVGKVTGVTRAGTHARLTMTVDAGAGAVHRDATVSLRPRLMFEGTAYAELALGSPGAPLLGERVIPVTRTSTYVPLGDALSVLRPRVRGDVRTVAGAAAGLLSGRSPAQLRDALSNAPGLTSDAATVAGAARGSHATELHAAVGSLAQVAAAVARQAPAIGGSLHGVAATAGALDTGSGVPIEGTLSALPQTVADVRAGAGAASAIVEQAARLVPQLQPAATELAPTLAAVRPLLRRAAPVMNALRPVVADAARAERGAVRGAKPALAAMAAVTPTLEIFQRTLLTALERPTDLGTPAYLAFLGLFAGGGGASRPFGVDGQGHFMRFGLRFLTGFGQPLPPCSLLDKVAPTVAALLARGGGCTP